MDIETRLDEFVRVVEFRCPAEFWPALGYEGEARYVAIWWERGGDEARRERPDYRTGKRARSHSRGRGSLVRQTAVGRPRNCKRN